MNTSASSETFSKNSSFFKKNFLFLLPWLTWGFGALFYFYEYVVQVSPNVMANEFMRDFSITANKLGLLSGIWFWAYAIMQLPAGMLLDNLGPHRLLAIASAVVALGSFTFGMIDNFYLALTARALIGAGSAFAVIGCLKITTNWFPLNKFSLMLGLTVAVGMTGAIIGEAPLARIMEIFTWREIMIGLSGVGIILSFVFLFFIKDYPKDPKLLKNITVTRHSHLTFRDIALGLMDVIKSKQIWLVATYGLLMFAPTMTLCGLWGCSFLEAKYLIDKKEAAALISIIFVGWVIGGPLTGIVSDYFKRRLPTMVIGTIGTLICMILIIFLPPIPEFYLIILMFLFGWFSSGFLNAFAIVRESSPVHTNASAIGFMNMMNTLGIAICQPLIGWILDYFWAGTTQGSLRVYSIEEFHNALLVLPVAIFIALLLLPFIKETYCQPSFKEKITGDF